MLKVIVEDPSCHTASSLPVLEIPTEPHTHTWADITSKPTVNTYTYMIAQSLSSPSSKISNTLEGIYNILYLENCQKTTGGSTGNYRVIVPAYVQGIKLVHSSTFVGNVRTGSSAYPEFYDEGGNELRVIGGVYSISDVLNGNILTRSSGDTILVYKADTTTYVVSNMNHSGDLVYNFSSFNPVYQNILVSRNSDVTINIGSLKAQLAINTIYTIICDVHSPGTKVTVQFGEIPRTHIAATSFEVLRGDASITDTAEKTKYKGVLHFLMSGDGRFVVY